MRSLSRCLRLILGLVLAANFSFAAEPQIINIGNGAEPKDLDPHHTTGVPESHIIQNLFEALVSKDPRTLAPVPGVAESWKISADKKTYTFKLRKDAKWSNGEPLTAKDFVYSWTRILAPETAAEYAYQLYYVKNGREYNSGKLKDASQLGFKAVDPYTFEVVLNDPTPFFLGLLYHHALYPVPEGTITKNGARWTRPGNLVSNGAFMLDKWEMNKVVSLKPNPFYWDKDKVKLTQANYLPVEKRDTEEKMFRAKELHVTESVPLEKIPFWQKDKSGVYQQWPFLGTYFYLVNVNRPPLTDKRVRKALALSLNRDRIVKFVTRAGQIPGTMFTPPGTGGYQPKSILPSDDARVAEAKDLLKQAGFPGGKGLPPIEIQYNTEEGHKKIGEAVQQMWKETLGIQVTLYNQEWKVYLDTQKTQNYQLSRMSWIADYNDPNSFLDLFVTGGGNNRTGWSNKTYDALIEKAGREHDAKKRLAVFQQAESILLEELPVIPVYIYTRVYLRSPLVQGWFPNIEDIHPLKYVSLGEKSGVSQK